MSQGRISPAAKGELVFTSFLFLAGLVVITDTALLPVPDMGGYVSPKVFSFAVGFLLTGLTLFQLVQVFRGKLGEPEGIEAGEVSNQSNWKSLALAIASLVFYVAFLQILGFIISATVLFSGVALSLGAKKKLWVVPIALALAASIYFGFTEGLNLNLPAGFEFVPGNEPEEVEW